MVRAAVATRDYGTVIVTPSLSLSEMRPPWGMHAPMPNPLSFGPAENSVCALASPLTFTAFPLTSMDTPLAPMNFGAFCGTTLRITCVPTGNDTPLLPETGETVVAVNLSPLLLFVLHTRDPDESSIVVPGPIVPVFATGAAGGGGGAGAGAGAGAGVAAGALTGAVVCAGGVAAGVLPLGSAARLGARGSGARCDRCGVALVDALTGATGAAGVVSL